MPATSKAQFRFMQAVFHGKAKAPGLSRAKAGEFVQGQSPKGLPERAEEAREPRRSPAAERKEEARESGPTRVVARLFRKGKR